MVERSRKVKLMKNEVAFLLSPVLNSGHGEELQSSYASLPHKPQVGFSPFLIKEHIWKK
jgi:hypothetical protein|tara:strand:- start:4999 stop:5175 length:177 start_codon:yes stop_codon:yes gene_type:complete